MDLRLSYCAFVVCALLDDWDGVDVDRAVEFVHRCRVCWLISSIASVS
jgi:geranylgeranyl transferase type-1 subunit beta